MKLSLLPIITIISLWAIAPNSFANSNADKLKAFFGEATNTCYSRYYSDEHLKKYPKQKVKAIHFEHIRHTPELIDEEKGEFYGDLYVQLKDNNWYFGGGNCISDEKGFLCGVEDDGGKYTIQKKGSKENPTLLISHNNLHLWEYDSPEDAEPTGKEDDTRKLLNAEPADKTYLLEADPLKFCLEEFKIEVSDGIDVPESSDADTEDTVELDNAAVNYSWKEGGEFSFKLTADSEINMKLEDWLLTARFKEDSKPVTIFDFDDNDDGSGHSKFSLMSDDYNFDGFKDFAVVTGVGYGGVNIVVDVFLYDESVNNFRRSDELTELSNIELDNKAKELNTSMKSGQKHINEAYRFKEGKPWQYSRTVWFAGDAEHVTIYNSPAKSTESAVASSNVIDTSSEEKNAPLFRKIAVDKATLYDKPRYPTETGMYLIKGDKVQVLDFTETNNGSGDWVLVRFKGKKLVEKWTPFESVDWENY